MTQLLSLDTAYPALIFKASRDTIHHGAVATARTLGRLGVPVYAIVEDRYTPLAVSRYLTKSFVWEKWLGEREPFLTAILTIGENIGRPTILFPMDDLSAVLVAENAPALSRWFLLPRVPRDVPRQLANKESLYSLCAKIGIPYARSMVPRSVDDVLEFIEHVSFPVVVKARDQWLLLSDRQSVAVVQDRQALLELYEHCACEDRLRMLLQEFIPGEDWIYHGYSNFDIGLNVSYTGRKLLSYPPRAGSTALGVSLPNKVVRDQSEMLLGAACYSGIVDMDWRRDARDGQYKIFDCNPRVGMNFRMFENSAAIDVIRAQHLDLTGRVIDRVQMISGRRFAVESFYLLSLLRGGRPTKLANGAPKHRLPQSRELAWWSGDDLLPFFVMSGRLFVRTTKRAVRWMISQIRPRKSSPHSRAQSHDSPNVG